MLISSAVFNIKTMTKKPQPISCCDTSHILSLFFQMGKEQDIRDDTAGLQEIETEQALTAVK